MRLYAHISIARKKQLAVLLVAMVAASLFEVISIGAVLPFLGILLKPEVLIDKLTGYRIFHNDFYDASNLILYVTLFFVTAVFLAGISRLLLIYLQTRIGFGVGADLSREIYRKTLCQPYATHLSRNTSQVIAGVTSKSNSVIFGTLLPIMSILSSFFILFAVLVLVALVNAEVAIEILLGFGLLYGIVIYFAKNLLLRRGRDVNVNSDKVIKILQEGLGGVRDVILDGTQGTYLKLYSDADTTLRQAQASIQFVGAAPRFVIESIGMAAIACIAYYLAVSDEGILSSMPLLGLMAVSAQRMLPVLQQLYASISAIQGSHSSLLDVLELLEQQPTMTLADPSKKFHFSKSIRFENVSFRYTDNSPFVIKDVNFEIFKGENIGVIGDTGSGKSTLLDLMMGLIYPTEGAIYVDCIRITPSNCRSWQMNLAHVPQQIFLADTTVSENIAFGVPASKIDMELVAQCAAEARIAEVIEQMAEGYHAMVGERGIRLSGGQKQRLGIARALYKQPRVLIFDEGTSALDSRMETEVMGAINNLGDMVTKILVAHRTSTLKKCDRIIILKNGCIIGTKKYNEIESE